ncbi:MAG: hypothetical protein LKI24_01135 [Acidipropionibacterium sp.]|nr:hypothetical protein [Acidipropionibacterium sp.]
MPDARAQMVSKAIARIQKITPKIASCRGTGPAPRTTNWGKRAVQIARVFGFVTPTRNA